jgi:transposase
MINANELSDDVKQYIEVIEKKYQTKIIQFEQKQKEYEQKIIQTEKQSEEKISRLEKENKRLMEELKMALYRKFGRLAEKFFDKYQLNLFDTEETAAPIIDAEPEKETVSEHKRSKRGRKPLDSSIPREEIIIDMPEEEKQCACGSALVCIGEEVTERLVIIPEQIFVAQYHQRKYACHKCEGSGDEDNPAVRMAKAPANIIPGSIATPSLLAAIFTKKYCDMVPFYRQQAAFERIGIHLSRQNMSNWQQGVAEKLEPLLALMKRHLKTGSVMRMDETTMQVMDEPDRTNTTKSYMWLARGGPPDKPVVIYEYHPTRASENATSFLDGFSGYLQTDGYEGYDSAFKDRSDIIHVGCWAHARRKFFEADKVCPKKTDVDNAMTQIASLYNVENKLRDDLKHNKINEEVFLQMRREKSTPILNAFHDWLTTRSLDTLSSSKFAKAINYTLNQWKKLIRYLDYIELTPDNNICERSIKPFVIGRKNWMLSGSPDGAKSSCEIFTLIESAKINGLNPYSYLETIFDCAANLQPDDDWSCLLPWNLNNT